MSGLFLLVLTSCSSGATYRFEEGIAWNTLFHITYLSEDNLSDSILTVFNEIDSTLSPFNPESGISKINNNETDTADSHFAAVYNAAKTINERSGGAFDPTLAPLIRAWGFGQGHEITADTLRLDSLLQFVGIRKTRLEGSRIFKEDPRIEFNFSALAKGYGVDCIADMLERNGVENYLVEVGGEIRAQGINPKGQRWTVGIDRPESGSQPGNAIISVSLDNEAIATSGNYRNFHESNAGKFGHTISPETGRPIATDVISASVIAKTCMEADAIATACMVLGSEKALNLCDGMRAGVMLVKSDMSILTNSIWQDGEPEKEDRD